MKINILIVFAVSALFLLSILLSGCSFLTQPLQPGNTSNTTYDYRIYGDPNLFFTSMYNSDNLSVVMDITDAQGDKNKFVFLCGTGIIGSWIELDKNISYLTNYVIDGSTCIKGIPTLNETINTTTGACTEEFTKYPYVYISYGQPESQFSNSSWKMVVDKEYIEKTECGFRPSETGGQ